MAVGLEHNPYRVLAVAGARVYHAVLDPRDSPWVYSGWKGTLTFGRDLDAPNSPRRDISEIEKFWFRLVDDETGSTRWTFKFPEAFEYTEDRPFFHVFKGRVRRYGFLFNDDDEAVAFGQKVVQRLPNYQPSRPLRTASRTARVKSPSYSISRSMVSSPVPQSFRHIAHAGVSKDGIFEASRGLDKTWKATLADLQGHGVTETVVFRNGDFGDGVLKY
ncbi:hypothetical protein CPB84DRAFT_1434462 [Gymnopilus junonius]|uniref:Uncharacterized protein n=1 Tax=Gymnopilus junonius TaxID=109634 RepID=A0A9P5NUI0_GYMJU|nr:hypothetical protein CPB84DRAFT_1434462 [Gymnopilus junonius]